MYSFWGFGVSHLRCFRLLLYQLSEFIDRYLENSCKEKKIKKMVHLCHNMKIPLLRPTTRYTFSYENKKNTIIIIITKNSFLNIFAI